MQLRCAIKLKYICMFISLHTTFYGQDYLDIQNPTSYSSCTKSCHMSLYSLFEKKTESNHEELTEQTVLPVHEF